MATLLVLILATLGSGTTNASPLLAAGSAPTLTQTGLLPAYTGNGSPLQPSNPATTGFLDTHTGKRSPCPAFNARQYPRHNFTEHHENRTHHHCEHWNRTVDGILRILDGERHHDKNGTHHRYSGTHCHDRKPHHPSTSGHAKLLFPDGDRDHQEKNDTRRLHESGYTFVELISRDVDDEAVPRYMEELEKHAVSPSSSSSEVKPDKAKRDIDDEHVPASVKYMEFTDEEDIPAQVKYMEYDDQRATPPSSPDVRIETSKRGEEDDDGLTSWELLSKSDLSLFGKRGYSNCVVVAGGILCKKDSTQQSGESLDDEEVNSHNEKPTILDGANIAGRVEYKPLAKRVSASELWLGDENAVPAHINGLD